MIVYARGDRTTDAAKQHLGNFVQVTRLADGLLGREHLRPTSLHKSKLCKSVDHSLIADPVSSQPSLQNHATPSCRLFVGTRISAKILQPICESPDQSPTVRPSTNPCTILKTSPVCILSGVELSKLLGRFKKINVASCACIRIITDFVSINASRLLTLHVLVGRKSNEIDAFCMTIRAHIIQSIIDHCRACQSETASLRESCTVSSPRFLWDMVSLMSL